MVSTAKVLAIFRSYTKERIPTATHRLNGIVAKSYAIADLEVDERVWLIRMERNSKGATTVEKSYGKGCVRLKRFIRSYTVVQPESNARGTVLLLVQIGYLPMVWK